MAGPASEGEPGRPERPTHTSGRGGERERPERREHASGRERERTRAERDEGADPSRRSDEGRGRAVDERGEESVCVKAVCVCVL